MVKIRLLVLLSTISIVGLLGFFAILYTKGFRLEQQENSSVTLSAKGLLVANSEPTGAQVYVDEKLETATNGTLPLSPGSHILRIQKEGFIPWQKTVDIKKEVVTLVNAYLLPAAPSLTALSFRGVINPQISPDFTKIAYSVPKDGLWLYETTNLPLGFSRDPKQITNADLATFSVEWSPDNREVLVASKSATYLLPINAFTDAKNLASVSSTVSKIKEEWATSQKEKITAQLGKVDPKIVNVFQTSTKNIQFSPDETKVFYTATASATIPTGLVNELPGSSTQKEERDLKSGKTYVYDVKEDKNFLVDSTQSLIYWLPNSLNIVMPQKDKIIVIDYDGTNAQTIFTGNYTYPYAFPTTSTSKMVILTSFGGSALPNLYWLSLK